MSLPRVVIQSLPFEEGFQLKLVKNLFKGNYVEYERVSDNVTFWLSIDQI